MTGDGGRGGLRLELRRIYPLAKGALFRILIDPERIPRWLKPTPGTVLEVKEYDCRVGGRFRFEYLQESGVRSPVSGVFQELSAPDRLVFTWAWDPYPEGAPPTVVTLSLDTVEGGTELTIVHDGFPDAASAEGYAGGWKGVTDELDAFIETEGKS